MPEASLHIAATVYWSNNYDKRSKKILWENMLIKHTMLIDKQRRQTSCSSHWLTSCPKEILAFLCGDLRRLGTGNMPLAPTLLP
jgi:hypothetical protein